tara:strand:+ start:179 stop:1018 length:840 start_codon:yes stop_codon:yes gene_type:complete
MEQESSIKPRKKYSPIRMYKELKVKYPNHIIFIRVGCFYEAFEGDAIECNELFDWKIINCYGSNCCAGIGHEAINKIIEELKSLKKHYIIVEQRIEDNIVKREIVEIWPEVKSNYMEESKKTHPNAYSLWTDEEEKRLIDLFDNRLSIKNISEILQRKPGGIRSRLKKLGKIDVEDKPKEPILLELEKQNPEPELKVDKKSKHLFEEIKNWADKKAKEKGEKYPTYCIIPTNNCIKELSIKKPTTMKELSEIKGFGGSGKRREEYGEDILEIIKNNQNQ